MDHLREEDRCKGRKEGSAENEDARWEIQNGAKCLDGVDSTTWLLERFGTLEDFPDFFFTSHPMFSTGHLWSQEAQRAMMKAKANYHTPLLTAINHLGGCTTSNSFPFSKLHWLILRKGNFAL